MELLLKLNLKYGVEYLFNCIVEFDNNKNNNASLVYRLLSFDEIQNNYSTDFHKFCEIFLSEQKKLNKDYTDKIKKYKQISSFIKSLKNENNVKEQSSNIEKYGIGVNNPSDKLIKILMNDYKYKKFFIKNYSPKLIYKFYFTFMEQFIYYNLMYYSYHNKMNDDDSNDDDSGMQEIISTIKTTYRVESISGIHISVLKSAIQKYIRRSMYEKALWSASRLDLFYYGDKRGEAIRTNFLHRLMIIFMEDIGFCGIQYWKQLDYLLMDICIKKRKTKERNREEEIRAIREVVKILSNPELEKTRSCSHLYNIFTESDKVKELILKTPYKNLFNDENENNKINQNSSFYEKLKYIYKLNKKYSKEPKKIFDKLENIYSNNEIINIGRKWQKELKLKENFLTWVMIYTDIVYTHDYENRKLLPIDKKLRNVENNWNDVISKNIIFDEYVYDKHTKVKGGVEKTTEYFAKESSIVIPESPLTNKWLKWIYMKVRGVNDVKIPEESDTEKESNFGEFKFRIQLTTSNSKTDVYLVTKDGKSYIMKGPFLNDEIPKKYIDMQNKKMEYGLPIINTKLVYLYPDRWPEGVPLGVRNKINRNKKYPFLVIDSIIPESKFKTRVHSSKVWEPTTVIDPLKVDIHFKKFDELNKQQMIDFYNAIAYRMKYKYTDLALRNFIIDKERLYSIDEESVSDNFSLLNELKKNNYGFIKSNYKKYRKFIHPKLVKYLDNEFENDEQ